MNVLALDLATKTGWAHSCGESGVWDLSIRRDESSGMRLLRLRAKLDEVMSLQPFDIMVFETAICSPKTRQGFGTGVELITTAKLWAMDRDIEHCGYSPSAIKKHATGKGNANKEKMLAAAIAKWNREFEDDNHVDACWLLDFAMTELNLA